MVGHVPMHGLLSPPLELLSRGMVSVVAALYCLGHDDAVNDDGDTIRLQAEDPRLRAIMAELGKKGFSSAIAHLIRGNASVTRYGHVRARSRVYSGRGRSRSLHASCLRKGSAGFGELPRSEGSSEQDVDDSLNTPLSFPCLDALESKTASLRDGSLSSGPEPDYSTGQHLTFRSDLPLLLDWGGVLPRLDLAYETWGTLNEDRSNAILLHTGLSASSHAHSTSTNPKLGWWEKFIGPGCPLDTNKHFVVCTNVLGGCYGSTGPGSTDPIHGQPYATRFPIITIQDMVRAQFRLLDQLDISKLYASVGASMGGMQSLAAAVLFPSRVGKVVSISGCARSHPHSIAMRHTQRQGQKASGSRGS